ncbi:hypothetical protein CPB84DRAFT_1728771 [Gymnopilus junonius]|uniref:Uncharacterized protein n=1 Tax=Gymnopilus junonius TaxID=109634 RepID=A0A9P5TPD5_GYMJU|nr:hypothetical protein CPB84DRAFT_1728771 [Gymnopilus junonius]
MDEPPLYENLNPYLHRTQMGQVPILPPNRTATYTRATFSRIVIPLDQLLQNLDLGQADAIRADPGHFLALVPFGAGTKFYKDHPHCARDTLQFVESLGYECNDLEVAKPAPRSKQVKNRDFDGPWPMIMTGHSPELRNFLLWQQTFAVTSELTFHALAFDDELRSWVIMNASGGAVKNDNPGTNRELEQKALGAIKGLLWHNTAFRQLVFHAAKADGDTTSIDYLVYRATASFDLHYVETKDGENPDKDTAPVWQLTGVPLTNDKDIHHEILNTIRSPGRSYFVGAHKLEINKRFVNCVWCKMDSHPGHRCPFPQTPDWLGPTPPTKEKDNSGPAGRSNRGNRHDAVETRNEEAGKRSRIRENNPLRCL